MNGIFPVGRFDKQLQANAGPVDYKNPEPKGKYDLVVIGAGTAGLVSAAVAAALGAKTALIEKSLMGGDCLNYGCVPSKAVIAPSRVIATVKQAETFGIKVSGDVTADFEKIMERMREKRAAISVNDSVKKFFELGVDVFLGQGKFIDKTTLEVDGKKLKFKKTVIATGARATVPNIENIDKTGYLTNETIFNLVKKPEKLLVLGAGPLGCELAQALNRLGVKVSLLHAGTHILDREDYDAAWIIQKKFVSEGIELILNAKTKKADLSGNRKRVIFEADGAERSIEVDEILVAAGRSPNVEGIGLENAGVRYDFNMGIYVNDYLQTSNKNIFAAGDICSPYKFTHLADFLARIAVQNALFFIRKKASALTIPWATYTSPEIAHVGINERDAQVKGIATQTFKVEFRDIDRAILSGEEQGFVKIIVKKGSDKILGATIVLENAGELISELTLAMAKNIGLGKIAGVIHPYPTMAEAIRKAGDMCNKTRLTPLIKKILQFIIKIS